MSFQTTTTPKHPPSTRKMTQFVYHKMFSRWSLFSFSQHTTKIFIIIRAKGRVIGIFFIWIRVAYNVYFEEFVAIIFWYFRIFVCLGKPIDKKKHEGKQKQWILLLLVICCPLLEPERHCCVDCCSLLYDWKGFLLFLIWKVVLPFCKNVGGNCCFRRFY